MTKPILLTVEIYFVVCGPDLFFNREVKNYIFKNICMQVLLRSEKIPSKKYNGDAWLLFQSILWKLLKRLKLNRII